MEARAEGWKVEGLHENGLADEQLQFTRVRRDRDQASTSTLEVGTLPPFVRIERTLIFGLTWQVNTRVTRVTPTGSAVVLEIPLLDGESVTSEATRVENGKALINIAPQESEVGWSSVFEKRAQVVLMAPNLSSWTEIWRLDISPI